MSSIKLRNLGFPRNPPEDREGLSRNRRTRGGHLGHSVGWQQIEGTHTHYAICIPIQQKPETRGPEGYGSNSSAPPAPQRPLAMEHGQQEPVQTPGGAKKQDKKESSHIQDIEEQLTQTVHTDSLRLTWSRPNQLSSIFTPFRNQQISDPKSPFFTIPGIFQEKTRIQGPKKDLFQLEAERVRTNYPETVGLVERSTQETEIVVHTSRIISQINRNNNPTQT
ncbi:hypothetical protein O181_010687 [Austropuccinia psidii MF-1]|uniref:Uncharacterized protein n=1 Tax=Austropuccinia psidii MF-1 TaxID=1389203 RepID=A0A9Q3BU83_9BASI|nr:hypothetical protein [Austropuccinia psidii MF-1]